MCKAFSETITSDVVGVATTTTADECKTFHLFYCHVFSGGNARSMKLNSTACFLLLSFSPKLKWCFGEEELCVILVCVCVCVRVSVVKWVVVIVVNAVAVDVAAFPPEMPMEKFNWGVENF